MRDVRRARLPPTIAGSLELVFLNGCRSERLGRALLDAGVPTVVCWSTLVADGAARVFARTFFQVCRSRRYLHGSSA